MKPSVKPVLKASCWLSGRFFCVSSWSSDCASGPFSLWSNPCDKKKKKASWLVASRFNSCLSAQHKYFSHSYLKSAAANQFVFVCCSSTRAVTFLYVSRSCILTSPLFRLQWKCSQQQAEGIFQWKEIPGTKSFGYFQFKSHMYNHKKVPLIVS